MSVQLHEVRKATSAAAHARDNLTIKRDGRHYAKVCCICDKIIIHGNEDVVSFEELQKGLTRQVLVKKPIPSLSDTATKTIHKYYTPKCLNPRSNEYKIVKELYLSPRSYKVAIASHAGLGCCVDCKRKINGLGRQKTPTPNPPTFAISNGLMFGPVPEVLKCLNSTEVALISIARVDKHVFSFQGGAHKQMKGWHTMYANDIDSINKTVNWCSDHLDNTHDEEDRSDNEEEDKEVYEELEFISCLLETCLSLTRWDKGLCTGKKMFPCGQNGWTSFLN
jgi:hypothetical protein